MMSPEDLNLFDCANSAEAGWEKLVRRGLRVHAPAGD